MLWVALGSSFGWRRWRFEVVPAGLAEAESESLTGQVQLQMMEPDRGCGAGAVDPGQRPAGWTAACSCPAGPQFG